MKPPQAVQRNGPSAPASDPKPRPPPSAAPPSQSMSRVPQTSRRHVTTHLWLPSTNSGAPAQIIDDSTPAQDINGSAPAQDPQMAAVQSESEARFLDDLARQGLEIPGLIPDEDVRSPAQSNPTLLPTETQPTLLVDVSQQSITPTRIQHSQETSDPPDSAKDAHDHFNLMD